MATLAYQLKRVYWETTAACNLRCIHCRRIDALSKGSSDELTTERAMNLMDDLAGMGRPVLILSGGEPLLRRDIYEIARYAKRCGLPVAISTNGTMVDREGAKELRRAGVYYASISFDGAKTSTHDLFRGKGNFARALRGFEYLKEAGIKVQINFTVTRRNIDEVESLYRLAVDWEACALYLFFLVPVGCGVQIADSQMLSTHEVENWLRWVCEKDNTETLPVKAICAPYFYRIQYGENGTSSPNGKELGRKGCLAGVNICFISHRGDVYPCGYLPMSCGNVVKKRITDIWSQSPVLHQLRDPDLLWGKCGLCSFKEVCGGCRARAFHAQQDILAEEPYCSFVPVG